MKDNTTHFGFEQIPRAEKNSRVAGVFDSVAGKYDLMNDMMSLGLHRVWKRFAIECSGVRAGNSVLDLAGGTGDLAARFSQRVGKHGQVVLADINGSMLKEGRDRLVNRGIAGNVQYVQLNGEQLPFRKHRFQCVSIGFGLRNFTDKQAALRSVYDSLSISGRIIILEFSRPGLPALVPLYDTWSFRVLPLLGKFIANDEGSYRYLAESIRVHPDQETLKRMMEQAGFEQCEYFNLCGGIVAVHRGYRI